MSPLFPAINSNAEMDFFSTLKLSGSAVALDFRFFFAYAFKGRILGPPLEKPKEELICI
jgi:hypothetical protein